MDDLMVDADVGLRLAPDRNVVQVGGGDIVIGQDAYP
jgi:hypothetical protein